MKKIYLLLVIMVASITIILAPNILHAQSMKSTVRLKNGVILKGEIVEYSQGEYMIVHLMQGYDMRIPFDDISSYRIKNGKLREYNLPAAGYFNYTYGGFLFLKTNQYEWIEVNMSVHTVNGYRLNDKYSAGIGFGLDRYGTSSAFPLYISFRRDLNPSKVTPFFNVNTGYGWMWESRSYNEWDDFDDVRGGIFWEIGTGLRINYKETALIFNYAYKRQNSELTISDNVWWRVEDTVVEHHKFRNMVLTIGLEF